MTTDAPLETKAYVVPQQGAPLELQTVTLPPLGEGQVQIEVTHVGLCHTDIHMRDNDWGISDYPLVPGHEGYGIVTHVGSQVQKLKVGDNVGVGWIRDACMKCGSCSAGKENLCQEGYQGCYLGHSAGMWGKTPHNAFGGCFSKVMRIAEGFAFPIPKEIPPEVACPLLCAGGTVYEPICDFVTPNSTVGVGSLGGLGTLTVQLAKQLGAKVIVLSRGRGKEEAAMQLGADEFVDSTDEEAMKKVAGSIDVVIDTCPVNKGVDHLLALCKMGGTVVRVGIPPACEAELKTNWIPLIFTGKKVAGSIVCGSERMNAMIKLVAEEPDTFCKGNGSWSSATVVPMEKINEAMAKLSDQANSSYHFVLKW